MACFNPQGPQLFTHKSLAWLFAIPGFGNGADGYFQSKDEIIDHDPWLGPAMMVVATYTPGTPVAENGCLRSSPALEWGRITSEVLRLGGLSKARRWKSSSKQERAYIL